MSKNTLKHVVDEVISLLTEERKKQGLSHEKLAALTGLHRSSISLIESRKREPTLLTLLKISSALKFDLGKSITKLN